MGLLEDGLDRIRDLWADNIDASEIGTDALQETFSDTDLVSPISAGETTDVTHTDAAQAVLLEANFHSTSASDEVVREHCWKVQSPELMKTRSTVGSGLTWDDDGLDLLVDTEYFFRGRR